MKGKIEVILVDIGNTQIKSAEVIDENIGPVRTFAKFSELLEAYPENTQMMISSTRSERIRSHRLTFLDHATPLPIRSAYTTPETLGMDRIAAAVGAYELYPNQNSLIIDMGTCITMDLITEGGEFMGGIISPGLKMRMKAMSHYTDNLPDISPTWEEHSLQILGASTDQCLLAGSFGGVVNEIEGVINKLDKDFTSINVILTGGDAHYFESKVKAHIFAGSKIVLTGLYRIWKDL